MTKNQLFKMIPPRSLCLRILKTFGINDFNDNHNFSRGDLEQINCVDNLLLLKDTLQEYYLPCKARTYLNDLNEKNIVTILRQILKHHNYNVLSKEKYLRGEKFILYTIVASDNIVEDKRNIKHLHIEKKSIIINFD